MHCEMDETSASTTGASCIALLGIFWGALLGGCSERPAISTDQAQLALGAKIYAQNCADCHGAKLEGQPNWREGLPNGRLPAPPHDDTGHTWHHPEAVLFEITKRGLVPPNAPAGYESDMPAFEGRLSDDEIRAVLAFIASRWSRDVHGERSRMFERTKK